MSFNEELCKHLNSSLKWWNSYLNENGDVVIVIGDDKILKSSFHNLPTILWLLVPEVPAQAVKTRIILINERRTNEYFYNYEP